MAPLPKDCILQTPPPKPLFEPPALLALASGERGKPHATSPSLDDDPSDRAGRSVCVEVFVVGRPESDREGCGWEGGRATTGEEVEKSGLEGRGATGIPDP